MATKQTTSFSTVTRCANCGEDYSITYKRCPFCDEKYTPPAPILEDDDEDRPVTTGRRVAGGGHRGGVPILRILGGIITLAIIGAAIWIMVTQIMPLVGLGQKVETPDVTPTPSSAPTATVAPTDDPDVTDEPDVTASPEPTVDPDDMIPSTQTATGFSLSKSDFTLSKAGETYQFKTTFAPSGSTGFITWTVDNPAVATVSEGGKVTGVSRGTTKITATMAGGYTQTCIVRCTMAAGAVAPTATPTPTATANPSTSTGDVKLNRSDFTLIRQGETFKLSVSGTDSNPIWAIGNTAVATIAGDGTVKAVAKGTTTVTATVDGVTLKCVVRCSF